MDGSPIPGLLTMIDDSPLWHWDSHPSLWAMDVRGDIAIVTPIIMAENLEVFEGMAQEWRSNDASIAVSYLCLIVEGVGTMDGRQVEVRDAISGTSDGELTRFRHVRGGETHEVDTIAEDFAPLTTMRLIAAAAWK